ncbi:MAG: hypothetical protein HY867_03460 [Chloroflexi bacterium]|nr:hypothetical protein [Chloroflexota bacterium]
MKNTLMSILLAASIIAACTPSATANPPTAAPPTPFAPTEVVVPTDTPQATVTPEPSAVVAPTETSTPVFDWATNFAAPILQAIAGQPPTYEDIFSDPNSGWYNGATSGEAPPKIDGEKRYDHGEYRITTNGVTAEHPIVCSGVPDENVGLFADFVAEFDVKFISGSEGDWHLQFHRNVGLYKAGLTYSGYFSFGKCGFGSNECTNLADTTGAHIRLDNYNHVQLIVKGTRMAAYINDIPTLFVEDSLHVAENASGYFSLNVCNAGAAPLDTKWDNFRVWDISGLP